MLLSESITDNEQYDAEVLEDDLSAKQLCGTVTVNAMECICEMRDAEPTDDGADIVFEIDFGDIKFEDHEATIVPFGSTYATYEEGGTELTEFDIDPEVIKLKVNDKVVSEEQFKQMLSLTDEEYNVVLNSCKKSAKQYAEEWINDHADEIIRSKEESDYTDYVTTWHNRDY